MGTLLFQHSSTYTSFMILMLLVGISYCQDEDDGYEVCRGTFDCGNLKGLSYPFWRETVAVVRPQLCRREEFKLICREGQDPVSKLERLGLLIKNVSLSTNTMTIAIEDFCHVISSGIEMPWLIETLLEQADGLTNISFFIGCNNNGVLERIPSQNKFQCPRREVFHMNDTVFYTNDAESLNPDLQGCRRIEIPVLREDMEDVMKGIDELRMLGKEGFNVSYDYDGRCSRCNSSGGICGTNRTTGDFACHCRRDHRDPYTCSNGGSLNRWRLKVFIGSLCGGIGILFATIVCYIRRRNNFHVFLMNFLQSEKVNHQDIESFMRNYGSLIPTRYSYADVKKITNLFKEKLGQGGFGSVYKGKLPDGRLVAVKILNETKGNGEEFINEVASISRTSHINIVSMLGFCLERRKRALIYEFMPNGSLETYIGDESHRNIKQHLELEKLYQIAIGVARGLEYLHRGCNTRIVHFDIKPHNILLDKDFCPKISDFGLAKLCTREKSTLSMLGARGTVGYIAPEVFSRNFGGVSHKSDVYSYGMVLLEMVGEKRKDENVASDASEKYFPYWVYKHLELNEFGFLGAIYVEDIEIVRKMAIVGLWCIQMNPSHRPSMSKVIEMLEGSIEILKIPPIPFLSSSPRSASDTCTLSLS